MRILLVDDNPNDRALVRREILRDHLDAEILEVDSDEGLSRALDGNDLDLAVLDYSIGWTNGIAVFRRLKERDPDCAAILFTGSLGEEGAVDAMKAGLDDYIIKDVSRLPRLRASVNALLAQKEHKRARRRAEARYRDLFQKVTVGLFACTPEGAFDDGNPALLRMLGLESVQQLGALNLVSLMAAEEARAQWHTMPPQGLSGLEVKLLRPDGDTLWVLLDAYPSAERGGVEGVLSEVTGLKAALEAQAVLLGEVYHRVQNNLQVVLSLLRFQARRILDPVARASLEELSARIHSLSAIQQRLYRGGDYNSVDFAGYLVDVTDAMLRMQNRPELHLVRELTPVFIPIDKAIPLGLIANELLTNALKHAFPEGRAGQITVELGKLDNQEYAMTIRDNGIGLQTPAWPADGGLGSQFIPRLAEQADARLEADGRNGLATTVRFKL